MEKDKIEVSLAIKEKERQQISDILHSLLATTYSLYTKTQHCHWNVTGKQFLSLHLLFQNQYEELAEAVDVLAERIRALGFFPCGSLSHFAKLSTIKDENSVRSSKEMTKQLLEDHQILIRFMRKHLSSIEQLSDGATADLINKRLAIHEKAAWILRSLLEEMG